MRQTKTGLTDWKNRQAQNKRDFIYGEGIAKMRPDGWKTVRTRHLDPLVQKVIDNQRERTRIAHTKKQENPEDYQ